MNVILIEWQLKNIDTGEYTKNFQILEVSVST